MWRSRRNHRGNWIRLWGTALAVATALAGCAHAGPPPATPEAYGPAIQRTLDYVARAGHAFDPTELLLLDFVQRRFGLPEAFAFTAMFDREPTPEEAGTLCIYRRLFDARAPFPDGLDGAPGFILTDLQALYCEVTPLPPDFVARVEAQAAEGGHPLVHAAIALQWARDLDYGITRPKPDPKAVATVHARVTEGLCALAKSEGFSGELGTLALAYLHYIREGGRIQPKWVRTLADAQLPSGGFRADPADSAGPPDPHVTILALWVLLEAEHPGMAHTPIMVQRMGPGQGGVR